MELKINYQYSYFIHPFVIKETKYQKYLLKILKDKRFELKVFQKILQFEIFRANKKQEEPWLKFLQIRS